MANVVLGFYGSTLDTGRGPKRWERWRPSVALCGHEDLLVDRFELLHAPGHTAGAKYVAADIAQISPTTTVRLHVLNVDDAWDFEEVFGALHDFAGRYRFDVESDEYLVHISTGTHVAQICWFLLTESRHFPAKLIQTSPPPKSDGLSAGKYRIIDLDLSRYDDLARRFLRERQDSLSFLKSGIDTRNAAFNRLIEGIERVALRSTQPILITGPTGAGKSQLAAQIYQLKHARKLVRGPFVEVNCATLRGDGAMSALFGHVKGAYTGALNDRDGLLRSAHGGILFLDEIGELGMDEQAMLLRAIEHKRFLPVGTDREVGSDFELIAGTNRNLKHAVSVGRFREDLLARINVWTFALPGLSDRPEDIEPNLDYELVRTTERIGERITMNAEARDHFLTFATSQDAPWHGNFRDLNAAVLRMATLAQGGRIDLATVDEEIARLRNAWSMHDGAAPSELDVLLGQLGTKRIDLFDRVQLEEVVRVCRGAKNLSDAGRRLFAVSRTLRRSTNDADRLRKYLKRFDLSWSDIADARHLA